MLLKELAKLLTKMGGGGVSPLETKKASIPSLFCTVLCYYVSFTRIVIARAEWPLPYYFYVHALDSLQLNTSGHGTVFTSSQFESCNSALCSKQKLMALLVHFRE